MTVDPLAAFADAESTPRRHRRQYLGGILLIALIAGIVSLVYWYNHPNIPQVNELKTQVHYGQLGKVRYQAPYGGKPGFITTTSSTWQDVTYTAFDAKKLEAMVAKDRNNACYRDGEQRLRCVVHLDSEQKTRVTGDIIVLSQRHGMTTVRFQAV